MTHDPLCPSKGQEHTSGNCADCVQYLRVRRDQTRRIVGELEALFGTGIGSVSVYNKVMSTVHGMLGEGK